MINKKNLQYDFAQVDGKFQQPREKLINEGPDILTNAELLANVFITGTRDEGVLDLSARCLKEYGSGLSISIPARELFTKN